MTFVESGSAGVRLGVAGPDAERLCHIRLMRHCFEVLKRNRQPGTVRFRATGSSFRSSDPLFTLSPRGGPVGTQVIYEPLPTSRVSFEI